jgi:hypothetical protein
MQQKIFSRPHSQPYCGAPLHPFIRELSGPELNLYERTGFPPKTSKPGGMLQSVTCYLQSAYLFHSSPLLNFSGPQAIPTETPEIYRNVPAGHY